MDAGIEKVGGALANAAMRAFVHLPPGNRGPLTEDELNTAAQAMRAAAGPAVKRLLEDAADVPALIEISMTTFALDVALAGLRAIGIQPRNDEDTE